MGWEDQGRQTHGWFGSGTSATVPAPPDQADTAREAVRAALDRLPRRMRAEFEGLTGRDDGGRMLKAMAVWTDAAGMDGAAFRRVVVGAGVPREGAAALQAMGRTLNDPTHPGTATAAGEHLATALRSLRADEFRFDLRSLQEQAIHAAAQGEVPASPRPPRQTIVVRPDGSDPAPPGPAPTGPAPTGPAPTDIPAIAAALTTAATRLGPVAIAALLEALPAVVLAAVLLYLLTRKPGTPEPEALVPAAPPPDQPGLVPPAAPAGKPGEGGFTVAPSPVKPGDGGFAPALPPAPGTTPAPALPVVTPKITPEEKERQDKKLRSLNLPTEGPYPFVPPKTWRASQALPRGPRKGYMDMEGNEWVKPRGKREGDEWHWDVQLHKPLPGNVRHLNVTKTGQRHH